MRGEREGGEGEITRGTSLVSERRGMRGEGRF